MGVFSRLNNAQKKLTDAENAMPGAYDNSYDQDIQDALQNMTGQNQAGTGYASTGDSYRGALSRLFNNAGAGADAAAQTAQGLSGGYGADWAQSAANQAAASQTGSTAGTLAQARADALTQWQQQLSGTSSQLNALLGQDQLERREYDGSVSNAADWRNYQYDQTQQARQEKSDFLSNAWNVLKNVGAAALEGYDAYRGYRQQDWENAFAERQYNDSLTRNELSDQMAALQQAAAYKQAGFDDAATQLLAKYGLDSTMLDTWQGLSQVDQDKLTYLTTAAGLAGSGYDTAAKSYLTAVGLDPNSIDYYSTIANRQNQSNLNLLSGQLQLQRKYGTKTGSSRSSGSRSSGKSGSTGTGKAAGYTQPQLNTMLTKYNTMKPTDASYDYYTEVLANAGRIDRLTGTGNPGKANGTPYEQGMYKARQLANSGYSQSQIASALANDSGLRLSSDLVSSIMNQIDYEWLGTK
nr:MAG TPA: hypothetical protein [Caudoviricetes sp.]